MGLFSDWKADAQARILLDEALRFGREFHDVQLPPPSGAARMTLISQIKGSGWKLPQAVFYWLVIPVAGALPSHVRIGVLDGAADMHIRGLLPPEVVELLMDYYRELPDPDEVSPS